MSEIPYLKDRNFAKARKLGESLGISPHTAGKILRKLGWTVWGSKTCTNKTFVRPGYEG